MEWAGKEAPAPQISPLATPTAPPLSLLDVGSPPGLTAMSKGDPRCLFNGAITQRLEVGTPPELDTIKNVRYHVRLCRPLKLATTPALPGPQIRTF